MKKITKYRLCAFPIAGVILLSSAFLSIRNVDINYTDPCRIQKTKTIEKRKTK